MKKIAQALFVLLTCSFLCGCPLIAGTVDSVGKLGITEQDRQKLLPDVVKKFYDACYWGNGTAVVRFVMDSEREKLRTVLKVNPEKIRYVESRVEDVLFSDTSRAATVTSRVKFFEVPYYVVHERLDTQEWRFTMSDGWKLFDMKSQLDPK